MNGNLMATDIKTALEGLGYTVDSGTLDAWKAICGAIVTHIQTNAQVATSVSTIVALGIAVQVVPATGTGSTVAPGAGSGSGSGTVT